MLLGLVHLVLETIVGSFFDANGFEFCDRESFQALENFHAQIFRCWHRMAKCRNLILQRAMIKWLDHTFVYESIELGEIRNHAGGRIDRAGETHFQSVVVAMAIGILALSEDAIIFFFRNLCGMQAVRSRAMITASKRDVESFAHQALPFAPLR